MIDLFEVDITEEGKIIDFLSGIILEPKPEEFVRQRFLKILVTEYQYSKGILSREVPIYYGGKEAFDREGNPVRADIVVYSSAKACKDRDQGRIELIVECKQPNEEKGHNQLISYIFNTSANGGVWFNGDSIKYYRRLSQPKNELIDWTGIPRNGESWDSLGRRRKNDLRRPKDIKGLLRRCHNKLHGRGVDGDEEDLTLEMVRLILAKAMDEELTGEYPNYYCTPEEYATTEGQKKVAERVHNLFAEVVNANADVFSQHEKISVGNRAICDVVIELQSYRLLSNLLESDDWDIMGYAYEQYTATYLKRQKGQFFTNRLVVDLMVKVVQPEYQDIVLDPAGGSGGFLTGVMRYVRKQILQSNSSNILKERQLDRHRNNLFMVEISKRLVKIAKTAMILNGDGHAGMTQGDSLGDFSEFQEIVKAKAGKGKPTIILTNPPFAGVGEGRISDNKILDNYISGAKWSLKNGEYQSSGERNTEGVPPEMLFFERCLQWISPGGRIGIVMPKSFLDTQTYYPIRKLLFEEFKILSIINCHKDAFQPHTGVRTCLVFIERPKENELVPTDYPIYMAISKKIGQDSEGCPIFKRDKDNNLTDIIDHDLDIIYEDYQKFKESTLIPSEYRFSILKSDIDTTLRINPQAYLPNLHETIRRIEAVDQLEGWGVNTIGQAFSDIKIYKGPRWKTENIITEEFTEGVEPYYTPSAILQEKHQSLKLLNLSLATDAQLRVINSLRLKRGDIVITRSGTIGRVTMITQSLHNAIISDDLIRVIVPDESLRFYIYAFLQSKEAYDQMKRNEYGAVQQHLEPQHVKDIIIPIPNNWDAVKDVIDSAKYAFEAKEMLYTANNTASEQLKSLMARIIDNAIPSE